MERCSITIGQNVIEKCTFIRTYGEVSYRHGTTIEGYPGDEIRLLRWDITMDTVESLYKGWPFMRGSTASLLQLLQFHTFVKPPALTRLSLDPAYIIWVSGLQPLGLMKMKMRG